MNQNNLTQEKITVNYQICKRCICDTTIPGIIFDNDSICNYCHAHDTLEKYYPLNEKGQQQFHKLVGEIKTKGRKQRYDCVIGVSGGTDSTYCLYLAKKYGLRPLAVHLDNSWNTETAISNINTTTDRLDIDLRIVKCDWEEFKELQIAFLRASISDVEIPTDVGIIATLYQVAAEVGVKYVFNGHSFRVEGLSPTGWTYMDGKYINSIYRKFTGKKLKHFPNLTISKLIYYSLFKGIKLIPFLSYFEYDKEKVKEQLESDLDWKYYGGHHFESVYTRWVITNLLQEKFGIDKRIVEFSAHVRSGQMTREKALASIKEPVLQDIEVTQKCLKQLGLTKKEYDRIMSTEPRTFLDYSSYFFLIRLFKIPIRIACSLNILPQIFYEKYFNWDYRALKTHYSS